MTRTEKLREGMEATLINQHKFDRAYAKVISRQVLVACKEAGLKFIICHAQPTLAPDIEEIEI